MLLKKHNSLGDKINQAVMDAVEAGLIKQSLTHNLPMEATLEATMKSQKQDTRQPLLMNHIVMPLRFWAMLLLVALLVLMVELLYWQHLIKNSSKEESDKGIHALRRSTSYLAYILDASKPKRSKKELLRIYSMGENMYEKEGHAVLVSQQFS